MRDEFLAQQAEQQRQYDERQNAEIEASIARAKEKERRSKERE